MMHAAMQANATITEPEREQMEHALGLDYPRARNRRAYQHHRRNFAAFSADSPDAAMWGSLVERGFAVRLGMKFGESVFAVSRRGCEVLGMSASMIVWACGTRKEQDALRAQAERARARYAEHRRIVLEQRRADVPTPVAWEAWEIGNALGKIRVTAATAKEAAALCHEQRQERSFEYDERKIVVRRVGAPANSQSHWVCRSSMVWPFTLTDSRRAVERRSTR